MISNVKICTYIGNKTDKNDEEKFAKKPSNYVTGRRKQVIKEET